MSVRCAAKTYEVPEATLRHRIKGHVAIGEKRNSQLRLTPAEEETLIRYIFDLDVRRFPPRINTVKCHDPCRDIRTKSPPPHVGTPPMWAPNQNITLLLQKTTTQPILAVQPSNLKSSLS